MKKKWMLFGIKLTTAKEILDSALRQNISPIVSDINSKDIIDTCFSKKIEGRILNLDNLSYSKKNFHNIKYGPALEENAEVLQWIKNLPSPNHNFINGEWIKSLSNKKISSINPANSRKLFDLNISSSADIDKAVKAAKKAFPSWSKTKPFERSKHLYALARLIQKHSRFLSVLESIDNGKPIRETRDIDIPLAARHFYYHAGWAKNSSAGPRSNSLPRCRNITSSAMRRAWPRS